MVAIGQAAAGLLIGVGQGTCGVIAVGQIAVGALFGIGQLSTGFVAIGQLTLGWYYLAQAGFGAEALDWAATSAGVGKWLRWFFTGN